MNAPLSPTALINPFPLPAWATLADVSDQVTQSSLSDTRKRDCLSALRRVAHLLEQDLARPVQEQVTLRDETVDVERRPVSGELRPGSLSGDSFQERTVEMEERDEQAVVSKEARVNEELVVRKNVEQRTETVSDKVRRTEVDVEDERGNRVSGTTGSPDRKR